MPDYSSNDNKSKLLQAGLLEVLFIVLLVTIILITLNYFNVVPLSSTFRFLAFLPRQQSDLVNNTNTQSVNTNNQQTTNQNQNTKTQNPIDEDTITSLKTFKSLITTPKTFNNGTGSEVKSFAIEKASIQVPGDFLISVDMKVSSSSEKGTGSLVFNNGLYTKSPKDYRVLRLFYYAPNKNWNIEYRSNEKSTYFFLLEQDPSQVAGIFQILIKKDGKSVSVNLPNGQSKSFNLPDSLYEPSNSMTSHVLAGPESVVTINRLSYRF